MATNMRQKIKTVQKEWRYKKNKNEDEKTK